MNRLFLPALMIGVLGCAAAVMGNGALAGDEQEAIMASPQTVVLAKVDSLTVHTNIPAVAVDADTVALNGVPASGIGIDNLGHLVARFALADLALQRGQATVTLTGLYDDGDEFAASDIVTVK